MFLILLKTLIPSVSCFLSHSLAEIDRNYQIKNKITKLKTYHTLFLLIFVKRSISLRSFKQMRNF